MIASKWIFVVVAVLVLLLVLARTGRATFHAEILIPASPEKVWGVLTNVTEYHQWNPLLVPKSGEIISQTEIVYEMTQPNGNRSDFTARILEVEEGRLIKQLAGMPMVLTADHEWRLEAVDGGTKVTQYEVDKGLWMWFWDSSWVQPTYERVNEALKAYVLELDSQ